MTTITLGVSVGYMSTKYRSIGLDRVEVLNWGRDAMVIWQGVSKLCQCSMDHFLLRNLKYLLLLLGLSEWRIIPRWHLFGCCRGHPRPIPQGRLLIFNYTISLNWDLKHHCNLMFGVCSYSWAKFVVFGWQDDNFNCHALALVKFFIAHLLFFFINPVPDLLVNIAED